MIDWKPEYELGIAAIDEQHRTWIALMNQLIEAKRHPDRKTKIIEVLHQLVDYTRYHFDFEDELLRNTEFEETERHREQHVRFRRQAEELLARATSGDIPLASETLVKMRDWFFHHIHVEDRKYAEFLKSRIAA